MSSCFWIPASLLIKLGNRAYLMDFVSFQWPSRRKGLGHQLAHGMPPRSIIFITNLFSQPDHFNSAVVSLCVFWWLLNACALHLASSHVAPLAFETWNRQEGASWGTHCASSAVLPVCSCFSVCGYVTPGRRAPKPRTGGLTSSPWLHATVFCLGRMTSKDSLF